MRSLLARYDGNRVLVAAAYNAGAHRVDRWLRDRPARPADIWIETIPFAETRDYVKNVLAFTYIYGQRLGHPDPVPRRGRTMIASLLGQATSP